MIAARWSAAISTCHRTPPPCVATYADPDSLPQALEDVEAIVHLAALFRTDDEDAIWKANLDGTRNLIAAAEAHAPGAPFIMASTGNVYRPDSPAERESDSCTPSAAYPASKLAAEELLRKSRLTWSILRLPVHLWRRRRTPRHVLTLAPRFGLHPAHTYSVVHHRDVVTASTSPYPARWTDGSSTSRRAR